MTIEHSKLLELLHYDPASGTFTWKVTRGRSAKAGQVAGTPHPEGYVQIGVCGRLYLAHRLAWFYVTGQWPAGLIDHQNRDRSDNRFENLRVCDFSSNAANSKIPVTNTSGVKGVSWDKCSGSWQVGIKKNGKRKHLGRFADKELAAEAYRNESVRVFGVFAS